MKLGKMMICCEAVEVEGQRAEPGHVACRGILTGLLFMLRSSSVQTNGRHIHQELGSPDMSRLCH